MLQNLRFFFFFFCSLLLLSEVFSGWSLGLCHTEVAGGNSRESSSAFFAAWYYLFACFGVKKKKKKKNHLLTRLRGQDSHSRPHRDKARASPLHHADLRSLSLNINRKSSRQRTAQPTVGSSWLVPNEQFTSTSHLVQRTIKWTCLLQHALS